MLCGVNAHHHNVKVEQRIKTIAGHGKSFHTTRIDHVARCHMYTLMAIRCKKGSRRHKQFATFTRWLITGRKIHKNQHTTKHTRRSHIRMPYVRIKISITTESGHTQMGRSSKSRNIHWDHNWLTQVT